MESLSENRPLLWSIALSGLAIVGLLTGSSPEFNEQFALVDIPTEVSLYYFEVLLYQPCGNYVLNEVTCFLFTFLQFKFIIAQVLVVDFVVALLVDRVLQFLLGKGTLRLPS